MLAYQEKNCRETFSLIPSYLSPKLISFLDEDTREEVLKTLVDLTVKEGFLSDKDFFYKALLRREKIVSTGIGMGVAVPHAKLQDSKDFFVVIGIHRRGVLWDAIDGTLVRLIFMIGGPECKQSAYLRLLSELTFALKDDVRRKKMLEACEPEEIIELFSGA
ncbi:MAG: PTS sugar transporter subunit IIA [Victivallaceae bacterium]